MPDWKIAPPPPPDSKDVCTCARPIKSPLGNYCATCGKKIGTRPAYNPPPSPPPAAKPATPAPAQKPSPAAPQARPTKPAQVSYSHPLEQQFMRKFESLGMVTGTPKPQPAPQQAHPQPAQPPAQVQARPTTTKTAAPPIKQAATPLFSGEITPPSQIPDPLNLTSPVAQNKPPATSRPPGINAPPGTVPKPAASPSAATPPPPSAFSLPTQATQPQKPSTGTDENLHLEFDIAKVEEEMPEEVKRKISFEATVEKFKAVITSKNKMLPYEFADELGIPDKIEEFYGFLDNNIDKELVFIEKDNVKINKTKIMGAMMLGDNSLLDKLMEQFETWLKDHY